MPVEPIRYPVIVRDEPGEMWLFEGNDPASYLEDLDVENNPHTVWDADGRGVEIFRGVEQALMLRHDARGDDRVRLEESILAFARLMAFDQDVAVLLQKHIPYPIVMKYVGWAGDEWWRKRRRWWQRKRRTT